MSSKILSSHNYGARGILIQQIAAGGESLEWRLVAASASSNTWEKEFLAIPSADEGKLLINAGEAQSRLLAMRRANLARQ